MVLLSMNWKATTLEQLLKHSFIKFQEYIFSFLLCSRIFLAPHELLGQLLVDIVVVVNNANVIVPMTTSAGAASVASSASQHGPADVLDQNAISSSSSSVGGDSYHNNNNSSCGSALAVTSSHSTAASPAAAAATANTVEQSLPALECLVKFLGVWTTKFPYDFRGERIMSHVKHIVAK